MNIEQGISISIGLVASYLIVRSVNYLCRPIAKKSNEEIKAFYKEKGVITREMLLPDIGGYQPIEPRVEYPINNLKEARLMLKQHYADREAMPEDTMGCNYTAIWIDEWQNISSIIIRLEAEEYVSNKYNLINQK